MKNIIKLIVLMSLLVFSFSAKIWMTIDKSQQEEALNIKQTYFNKDQVTFFYWDNAIDEISKRLKRNDAPDILLTGHTYVPYIADRYSKSFEFVQPIFLDIRALYVWGDDFKVPVGRWRDILFYMQNHNNFLAFPKEWTPNRLYDYLSFFNDQLPFWISQTPFSTQNMVYTVKLMYKLFNNYPRMFKEDTVQSFLNKENSAIISGLWMYNLLLERGDSFSVYDVPRSQNGVRGFKGAYVAIYFNSDIKTLEIKEKVNSYEFQHQTWEVFQQLPTNVVLRGELSSIDKRIAKLYEIADVSPWATSIDPYQLNKRTKVFNFLLGNNSKYQNLEDNKMTKLFNNDLYFTLFRFFR